VAVERVGDLRLPAGRHLDALDLGPADSRSTWPPCFFSSLSSVSAGSPVRGFHEQDALAELHPVGLCGRRRQGTTGCAENEGDAGVQDEGGGSTWQKPQWLVGSDGASGRCVGSLRGLPRRLKVLGRGSQNARAPDRAAGQMVYRGRRARAWRQESLRYRGRGRRGVTQRDHACVCPRRLGNLVHANRLPQLITQEIQIDLRATWDVASRWRAVGVRILYKSPSG